jgi:hypothetical protein
MPLNPDGSLRSFTPSEITAMELVTVGVRDGAHPTETREIGQSTMRRSYFCKWERRYDAVELICGNQSFYLGGDSFNHISRLDPDPQWGQHPYATNFVATKIERMSGHGRPAGEDANGLPQYPQCRLEVLLETVPYYFTDDATIIAGNRNELTGGFRGLGRYIWTAGSEVGGDSITGKGGMMKYRTAGGGAPDLVPVPYSFNVVRPNSEWSLKWERVPYAALAPGSSLGSKVNRGGSYVGMINKLAFYGEPAGTVLFLGASLKLQKPQAVSGNIDLLWVWSVEYKFVSAPDGWLNLMYFDLAGAGALSGFYYVGMGAFKTPANVGDYQSIVKGARDLNDLFVV